MANDSDEERLGCPAIEGEGQDCELTTPGNREQGSGQLRMGTPLDGKQSHRFHSRYLY